MSTVFSMSRRLATQPTERITYFVIPLMDHSPADGRVRPRDRPFNFPQPDPTGPELVGVDIDLIFARNPAHAGDLGHARHRGELIPDVPILDRAEFSLVFAVSLDGVPEDLPRRRGVGGHVRRDALRQVGRRDRQLFLHPLERNSNCYY
jgi:hypothetical protein